MTLTPTFPSATGSAHLRARGITHSPGGSPLLHHVDATVSPTTKLAIVGANGRGKTTLLRILTGRLTPDRGTVDRAGSLAISDQDPPPSTALTVGDLTDEAVAPAHAALAALDRAAAGMAAEAPGAEDAYAHALESAVRLDAWDADRLVDVALEALGAETDRSRRLDTLSVGQRCRVRLACVLGAHADLLVLDEPTNHLDAAGLEFLTQTLRARAGGVLLVSHDAALLEDAAEEFLDLDPTSDGRPRHYGGGWDGWRSGRVRELEAWQDEYEAQQAEHRRLQQAADQARARLSTGWRPDKGTGRHQRQSRAPGIVQAVRRREDDLQRHAVTLPPPPARLRVPRGSTTAGAPLITTAEVALTSRSPHPVSVGLAGGDRLLVVGPNGAGKSTLLGLVAGTIEADTGTVRRHGDAAIGYVQQEEPASRHEREHRSPGQQQRQRLSRVLGQEPDVLLLDEPTNHLSISLVDDLLEGVERSTAAVVIATHDRQVLRRLSHWPRLMVGSPCL